jgi:uncharacterized protein DUF3551
MKFALCCLGVVIVTMPFGAPARARDYPWCAYYTGPFSATNCGFDTFQQCLATISGVGGYCQPNTTYVPPSGRPRRSRASPY